MKMKWLLATLAIILLLSPIVLNAQYTYKIKADSVRITNDSCNAELIVENATRHLKGFLYNRGNGRTEFRKGMIRYRDSLYIFGDDTLNINSVIRNNLNNSGGPTAENDNLQTVTDRGNITTTPVILNGGSKIVVQGGVHAVVGVAR